MNAAVEHGDDLSGRPKGETENWGQDGGDRRDGFLTEANIYEIAEGIRCLPEFFNAAFRIPVALIYSSTASSS